MGKLLILCAPLLLFCSTISSDQRHQTYLDDLTTEEALLLLRDYDALLSSVKHDLLRNVALDLKAIADDTKPTTAAQEEKTEANLETTLPPTHHKKKKKKAWYHKWVSKLFHIKPEEKKHGDTQVKNDAETKENVASKESGKDVESVATNTGVIESKDAKDLEEDTASVKSDVDEAKDAGNDDAESASNDLQVVENAETDISSVLKDIESVGEALDVDVDELKDEDKTELKDMNQDNSEKEQQLSKKSVKGSVTAKGKAVEVEQVSEKDASDKTENQDEDEKKAQSSNIGKKDSDEDGGYKFSVMSNKERDEIARSILLDWFGRKLSETNQDKKRNVFDTENTAEKADIGQWLMDNM